VKQKSSHKNDRFYDNFPVNKFIGKYEFCQNENIINIQLLIELTLTNSEIDFVSQSLY